MQKRNPGIELLRIFSMFLIIILHINGAGGLKLACTPLGLKYELVQLFQVCAFCAVNCFALISGYVSTGGGDRS